MPERRGKGRHGKGKHGKGPQRLGDVRWEGYDHRVLWNMIMDARPDDVFDRHYRWVRLGRDLVAVNDTVQGELNTLFQTWQGTAAMSAALSNSRLLQWSQETAEATERIGEELGAYGNALVQARRQMPQPRLIALENEFRAGEGAQVWSGPENAYTLFQLLSDHRATATERSEAKERAVEVMRAFEADAVGVQRRLDTYSPAPNVAQPAGAGGGQPAWSGGGPGDVHGIELPSEADWPAATDPASVGPVGGGYASGGPYGPGGSVGYGPAGGSGPGAAYGAGGYGGYGPGGPTEHGAGVRGFGGGPAEGAAARGGPGQAFGAANRGTGPAAGAAAEAAAVRGTGGTGATRGGSGMLYPPGAGGPRDDEHEKRVAPYLVDDEDLFDDERRVAPPVFGA